MGLISLNELVGLLFPTELDQALEELRMMIEIHALEFVSELFAECPNSAFMGELTALLEFRAPDFRILLKFLKPSLAVEVK